MLIKKVALISAFVVSSSVAFAGSELSCISVQDQASSSPNYSNLITFTNHCSDIGIGAGFSLSFDLPKSEGKLQVYNATGKDFSANPDFVQAANDPSHPHDYGYTVKYANNWHGKPVVWKSGTSFSVGVTGKDLSKEIVVTRISPAPKNLCIKASGNLNPDVEIINSQTHKIVASGQLKNGDNYFSLPLGEYDISPFVINKNGNLIAPRITQSQIQITDDKQLIKTTVKNDNYAHVMGGLFVEGYKINKDQFPTITLQINNAKSHGGDHLLYNFKLFNGVMGMGVFPMGDSVSFPEKVKFKIASGKKELNCVMSIQGKATFPIRSLSQNYFVYYKNSCTAA